MPSPEYYQPPRAFYGTGGDVPPQVTGNPPPTQAPTAPPPPYYYGAPTGGVAPYNPYGDAVTCAPSAPPAGAPLEPTTTYQPSQEITTDFSRNEHTCTSAAAATGNPTATHLNFHDNRLRSLGGLERFPNLLRLTVSWNDLQSLQGLEKAPYLRWVDGSGNHLVDFTGMGNLPALEWLNLTQGDMTSFRGLGFAPNLTWLCLHHNRFNDFRGIEKVPALQFLDVSDNEVRAVTGLERATALREINLCNNPMCEGDVKSNVASVKKLAALPHLVRLNINDTFYDKEEEDIGMCAYSLWYLSSKMRHTHHTHTVAYFRTNAPKCEVITTPERTAQVGHNYKFKGQDCLVGGKAASGSKGKKCRKCCIQ